jgi:hypothetical protein
MTSLGPINKKKGENPFPGSSSSVFRTLPRKRAGEVGNDVQKRGTPSPSPDAVGANKKTSIPSTSDRSTKTKTTNLNLTQGKTVDTLRTVTSYFDVDWNAFAEQMKDVSIQWILEQIVGIGEDFHSQVDDDKVKTTLYVRSHHTEGAYFHT